MSKKIFLLLALGSATFFIGCNTDTDQDSLVEVNKTFQNSAEINAETDFENIEIPLGAQNRGANNCNHVVIINGYAYASCNSQLFIENLETGDASSVNMSIIDVAADEERSLLFTYNGSVIRMYTLDDPMDPEEVDSASANFSVFTGFSAAGCTLAVSGGTSNTTVYQYSANTLELTLSTNSIPAVDNVTGTPNVHVAVTGTNPSEITAFYSQDIGQVANWAIQPAIFNGSAQLQSTPSRTVLTPLQFTGTFSAPFAPTNFGVESEYLDGRLYVAHFAVPGIEVVDVATGDLLNPIDLPYEPINIVTDGTLLFVVGIENNTVDVVDPKTGTIIDSLGSGLQTPTGVAANETHVAVADQGLGLIVIPRDGD